MKKVSVIMSTYKEPINWVVKCIESVVNQTIRPYEYIIIVDFPDNEEMISMLKDYEKKYPFIKVFINEVNMGLVNSLNRALSHCNGDYIARIDADDYAFENRFEKQLDYMDKMDYDIVGAGYNIFFDDKIKAKIFGKSNDKLCKAMLKYSNCVAHPTWFCKAEVYKKLDGYRNIDACEDLDFLIRAALSGYKIGCVKEQLLWYRDNPDSISHEKNNRQKALQLFLCENYRKHKDVTVEMYNSYIDGALFQKRVQALSEIQNIEVKLLKSRNIDKIILQLKLFFNKQYRNQLIINQKIKIINKLHV